MDGFGMLKVVKAEPEWSEIPVVMVTGLRARADVLKAQEHGAAGYVLKPFDHKQLIHRVNACLERHAAGLGLGERTGSVHGAAEGHPDNSWLL